MMKRWAFVLMCALAVSSVAETLRLPAQYTLTTTSYSRLTGITVDERSKDTLSMVTVDIKKVAINGEKVLSFTKRPGESSIDKTSAVTGTVPYDEKGKLVLELAAAKRKLELASVKKIEETTVLYKSDSFKAVLTVETKKPSILVTLGSKDTYETTTLQLSAPQVQQLIDVVKRQ